MSHLVILNYHGIESRENQYDWFPQETPYVLNLSQFESQLDLIQAHSFQTLSLTEFDAWLEGKESGVDQIVLTFDDGHISHHGYVLPCLKKRKMRGIFLISAGLTGQKNFMNWDHLKELVRDGFEIGSHGLSHQPLSDMTHHQLWKELQKSKTVIEDKLGVKVDSFSVPRGYYQMRIREVALELGYKFVFTSRFDVNLPGQDRYRLNRIAIKRITSNKNFLRFVSGNLGFKRTIEKMKEGARRFIKPSFYDVLADLKRKYQNG